MNLFFFLKKHSNIRSSSSISSSSSSSVQRTKLRGIKRSKRVGGWNRIITYTLFLLFVVILYFVFSSATSITYTIQNALLLLSSQGTIMQPQQNSTGIRKDNVIRTSSNVTNNDSPSFHIVKDSYERTYSNFISICNTTRSLQLCMIKMQRALHDNNNNNNRGFSSYFRSSTGLSNRTTTTRTDGWPWWFKTMIMNGVEHNTLHGKYHYMKFSNNDSNPLIIDFCFIEQVIEKSGQQEQTKVGMINKLQWEEIMCLLDTNVPNKETCFYRNPSYFSSYSFVQQPNTNANYTTTTTTDNNTKVVFIRDPLERFFLGFMNNCILPIYYNTIKNQTRNLEKNYCGPNLLYKSIVNSNRQNNTKNTVDNNDIGLEELLSLNSNSINIKRFFELYGATMPLEWNVHFFPQSLYCDGFAFRHAKEYNTFFVVPSSNASSSTFYHHNSNDNGNQISFLKDILVEECFKNNKSLLRRVLQYYSIDYILFNLTIPAWVDKILLQ